MGYDRAGEADTFPKLLIHNAAARGSRVSMRHKDFGIWQSWTWAQVLDEVRAFSVGLEELGLKRGDKFAIIGGNRPRLYWAMCAGQALGAVPVPIYADSVADEMAYVLEHAEVDVRGRGEPGAGRQAPVDLRPPAAACATWSMTSRAACATTTARKLSWIDDVQKLGREKLAADPARLGALGSLGRAGQGRRPRRDPLHLGHDRAAEGRDAHLRQRHHLGAQRQRLRQARRERGDHRLSAARLGRRSPLLLRAALCRGLLRQLPGGGRDRGGGPARDRHDLCVRAAARLREPADADHGAHGGCRARSSARCSTIFIDHARKWGEKILNKEPVPLTRAADLRARRCPGLWAAEEPLRPLRASASATRRARRSGRRSSASIARSAST